MSDSVRVIDYDERWPALYEQEQRLIGEVLGPYAVDVQHVGSTSVPGLAAKPIIDIAVGIESYPLPDACLQAVVDLGYEHMGEYGIPRRHYFRKGLPRTHHVHVVELSNREWEHFVLFRDYLRSHPDAIREYEALKRELAQQYEHDRETYTDSKAPFIQKTLAKARAWRDEEAL